MDKEAIHRKLNTPEAKARRAKARQQRELERAYYGGDPNLSCSFCFLRNDVAFLIAGPGVYICDECVKLCVEIMQEKGLELNAKTPATSAPPPRS